MKNDTAYTAVHNVPIDRNPHAAQIKKKKKGKRKKGRKYKNVKANFTFSKETGNDTRSIIR